MYVCVYAWQLLSNPTGPWELKSTRLHLRVTQPASASVCGQCLTGQWSMCVSTCMCLCLRVCVGSVSQTERSGCENVPLPKGRGFEWVQVCVCPRWVGQSDLEDIVICWRQFPSYRAALPTPWPHVHSWTGLLLGHTSVDADIRLNYANAYFLKRGIFLSLFPAKQTVMRGKFSENNIKFATVLLSTISFKPHLMTMKFCCRPE